MPVVARLKHSTFGEKGCIKWRLHVQETLTLTAQAYPSCIYHKATHILLRPCCHTLQNMAKDASATLRGRTQPSLQDCMQVCLQLWEPCKRHESCKGFNPIHNRYTTRTLCSVTFTVCRQCCRDLYGAYSRNSISCSAQSEGQTARPGIQIKPERVSRTGRALSRLGLIVTVPVVSRMYHTIHD